MKQSVTFDLPVYKDQTSAPNRNIVAIGDTVRLVISNDGAASTTQDVVLTGVGDSGKTIQWDAGTTGNLGTRHVSRVHRRHQYHCPGADDWQAVLTESSASSVAASVTSLTINGIVYEVGVTETAAANGIQAAFVTALVAELQALFGANGSVTGVVAGSAGSQTLTIRINGTNHVPSTWALLGLTAGAWTNP